jgi:hypothetical protein
MAGNHGFIFDLIYPIGMATVGAMNVWVVHNRYQRSMKRLVDSEIPTSVRKEFTSLAFYSMIAAGWGVLAGAGIASAGHKWIEVALLASILVFICTLALRPFFGIMRQSA